MKYSFKNDYSEGAHPRILEALMQTNLIQQPGYGLDDYCLSAAELIRDKIRNPNAAVHFVSGGTQANLISVAAFLRPHESVIAAESGHVYTNETGAVEATGHKVHPVSTENGKISPEHIVKILDTHQNKPHQLKPKLVYISNSTELGTVYGRDELIRLYTFCRRNDLILYLDGARLGHALTACGNDLSLYDIGQFTDAFYLGGTKNGALIGEAVIINNKNLQPEFSFHLKQRGALLAKGRLLGIQFLELLKDGLYFDLAQKANQQAVKIKQEFADQGYSFLTDTFTNQIFPVLPDEHIRMLAEKFDFYIWKNVGGGKSAIRVITSWATEDETVEYFIREIKRLNS